MKRIDWRILVFGLMILLVTIGCNLLSDLSTAVPEIPLAENTPTTPKTPTSIPTPLPEIPVRPLSDAEDEPVFILGEIPYTSPFFLNTASEPFVMLEDQAGFVERNREFEFALVGQAIGPVEIQDDLTLTYSLALPTIPQGTLVDVDHDGETDSGVQVFAVGYWSNTWGGPFLERRDGTGWSTAYASTITDPEKDDEIIGGTLIVWAADEEQGFPSGYGEDGLLFTEDDPIAPIAAGYNIVDLNQEPFQVYKESRPTITLIEGDLAVNDFSDLSYEEAFQKLFDKASREYPFTEEKGIDWQGLYDKYTPIIQEARTANEFYEALRDFSYEIPDGHVGVSFNPEVFFNEQGGSFGLVLAELSDGRVIVKQVIPGTPGESAGIEVGTEIVEWDKQPVQQALDQIVPYLGPYSTEQAKRQAQLIFLTRVPPGNSVEITYRNPGESETRSRNIRSDVEYESLFQALTGLNEDELALPIEGEVLDDSGIGYVRISTFNADYRLMASLWEYYIQSLIDNEVPALIIDLRSNGGGSSGLAFDFAGYFFDEEFTLFQNAYYNEISGEFEFEEYPARIRPAPFQFEGPIAVLVSPDCVSACEGFAYALSQDGRAIIIGHMPTAGAFGEVGRGQYDLPDELSMQFPTGRSETLDGELVIEGTGVELDIQVPVTEESVLGEVDALLQAAIEALLREIR